MMLWQKASPKVGLWLGTNARRGATKKSSRRGTWGVIGLGYSTVIGKNQTFYVDAERYVGNDFSRTYDIRAGINWKF